QERIVQIDVEVLRRAVQDGYGGDVAQSRQRRQQRRTEVQSHINRVGPQLVELLVGIGVELDSDLIQVGTAAAAPPVRIANQRQMVPGYPLLEHERPGADHHLVEGVRTAIAARNVDRDLVVGDVAGLRPDLLQQVIRQDAVRSASQREVGGVDDVEVHRRRVV